MSVVLIYYQLKMLADYVVHFKTLNLKLLRHVLCVAMATMKLSFLRAVSGSVHLVNAFSYNKVYASGL